MRSLPSGIFAILLTAACATDPTPLPTQVRVSAADAQAERSKQPPLYQLLYDYAFLPEVQYKEQRSRILIWLRHSELSDFQLAALESLATRVGAEHNQLEEAQRAIVERYEPRIAQTYDAIWEGLQGGASLTEERLEQAAGALLSEKLQHARESEMLEMRMQGVRSILELEKDWLAQLTPKQEILLTDAIFFLRHRLDPYARPGDFESLVGSVFIAGDWGTLTRGTWKHDEDHLNIGGLWSDKSIENLEGPVFNDLRRELVLYMMLLEPALPEAIAAARRAKTESL
ncbi:MAG: hypothetical protein VX519_06855 [Myxococcota bacterium]|nr:hypothetical protein [Myxococcota bacterium]